MNQLKYRLAQLVSSTQRTKTAYEAHRRVLMYHSISQHKQPDKDIYSLSQHDFAQHVELLSELHKTENSKVVKLDKLLQEKTCHSQFSSPRQISPRAIQGFSTGKN
jgi:hypothetical protein